MGTGISMVSTGKRVALTTLINSLVAGMTIIMITSIVKKGSIGKNALSFYGANKSAIIGTTQYSWDSFSDSTGHKSSSLGQKIKHAAYSQNMVAFNEWLFKEIQAIPGSDL
jgi:hypothetical protein